MMQPDASLPAAPPHLAADRDGAERHGGSGLKLSATVFGVWLLMLLTLVVLTANPVTLNRHQVFAARLIVEADVADASRGLCRVHQSWPAVPGLTEVQVSDLPGRGLQPEEHYLIPLSLDETGQYRITPVPNESSTPRIYPATAPALAQLEELLAVAEHQTTGTGRPR